MNRKLLTGLTIASVAGTGGAAYATMAQPADKAPTTAAVVPLVTTAETATTAVATTAVATTTAESVTSTTSSATSRTIAYQVGDAGMVTVDVAGSGITSRGLVPASGWNIGTMSNSATHLEVRFVNTERIVGFDADLVGADVVVSVTNDRLPGSTGPVDPLVVSVVGGSGAPATVPVPVTAPTIDTVVPATPAPAPTTVPAPVTPSAASTTAPSSAGASGDDDDGEYEEHEGNESGHSSDNGESEGGDDD